MREAASAVETSICVGSKDARKQMVVISHRKARACQRATAGLLRIRQLDIRTT